MGGLRGDAGICEEGEQTLNEEGRGLCWGGMKG